MGRMTRYSQAEKMEIIRLVEMSDLSVQQTLAELDVPRSTFYDWHDCYIHQGFAWLAQKQPQRRQFWNRIPDVVRQRVVEIALERRSCRHANSPGIPPTQRAISSLNPACIVS